MNSTLDHPLAPSMRSPTPPKDPTTTHRLSSSTIAKFQELFKETVSAYKTRKAWSFRPLCERERVQMSAKEFTMLYETLNYSESDQRFPSISFNSRTSTGIIKWMPSPVHAECAAAFVQQQIVAANTISPIVADRIRAVGSQDVRGFTGRYEGSDKQPDALFKYEQPNGDIIYTCAFEIGFSEKYEDLLADTRLWIEGREDIMTVILINVEEDTYQCPTRGLEDDEVKDRFPHFSKLGASMVHFEDPLDPFGSLSICGYTWVNRSTAFLEIWKRDDDTGKARRHGARENFIGVDKPTAELDVRLKDLYPIDPADGGNERVPVTWEHLRRRIGGARKELAVLRCEKILIDIAKREDSINDLDYTP